MTDERAIRELIEKWATATRTGDIETVLDLMTDDVVFMVPGQKPFGKDAFRRTAADMEGATADGVRYESESDIEEIRVFDDWAYARTRLRVVTIPSDGSDPLHRSGYTLSIFRRDADDRWRLARDANLLAVEE